jgi:hypothetical protein
MKPVSLKNKDIDYFIWIYFIRSSILVNVKNVKRTNVFNIKFLNTFSETMIRSTTHHNIIRV